VGTADKNFFQGLPSPAAAAVVTGMMWVGHDYNADLTYLRFPALLLTMAIGLLMVSTIRYRSFKDLDLRGKVPFVAILLMVMVYVFISIDPPQVLFFGFLIYAASGPLLTLKTMREKRQARKAADSHKDHPV
jgi:CDP-diacylglycerol--serine O-phosphatidyltransferase